LRRIAFADLAGILVERDIPHIVRTVFDVPVAPPPSKQLARVCSVTRYTGNSIVEFDRLDAISFRCTNLGNSWPIAKSGQCFGPA